LNRWNQGIVSLAKRKLAGSHKTWTNHSTNPYKPSPTKTYATSHNARPTLRIYLAHVDKHHALTYQFAHMKISHFVWVFLSKKRIAWYSCRSKAQTVLDQRQVNIFWMNLQLWIQIRKWGESVRKVVSKSL